MSAPSAHACPTPLPYRRACAVSAHPVNLNWLTHKPPVEYNYNVTTTSVPKDSSYKCSVVAHACCTSIN